jgi:hypothetical protein
MKRHTNKCLQFGHDPFLDDGDITALRVEMKRGHDKFGDFNSTHELYAVLQEEVDEFWDSVKSNDPDPMELLQVAAVALRGAVELCARARQEQLVVRNAKYER